jgi:hypothetical protein|nr:MULTISPECIES: hypothetical protein [Pseudomonas]
MCLFEDLRCLFIIGIAASPSAEALGVHFLQRLLASIAPAHLIDDPPGLNGISVQVAVRVEHQAARKGVVRILDQCTAVPIITKRDTEVTDLSDTAKAATVAWIALGWLVQDYCFN